MAQYSELTRPTVSAAPQILEELDAGLRRSRRRFAVQFALTWVAAIGTILLILIFLRKIDPAFIWIWAPFILGGVPVTIVICAFSIVLATVLALIGAIGRLSRNAVTYALASLYVSLMRGTPLIVQIYFIFLALPQLGIVIPALPSGILALGLNYGAYMTE